jgi:hypothetical protein
MFNDHIRLTSITVRACSLPLMHHREDFTCTRSPGVWGSFFFGMRVDKAIPKVHNSSISIPVSVSGILYVRMAGVGAQDCRRLGMNKSYS